MPPQHNQYNTNTVTRGSNIALNFKVLRYSTVILLKKGLVSGTQVVLQWHASGLLKT